MLVDDVQGLKHQVLKIPALAHGMTKIGSSVVVRSEKDAAFFAADRIEFFPGRSTKRMLVARCSRATWLWVSLASYNRCAKIAINFDITIKD